MHIPQALIVLTLLSTASAAVRLPDVDCTTASKDARCTLVTGPKGAGRIGTGTALNLGGFTDTLGSGFVDVSENALYLPFDTIGQTDAFGGIIKVDLATGNRTLVSGMLDDTTGMRGKGATYVSDRGQNATEWGLGRVTTVRPGPDAGSLYALQDYGSPVRTTVLKIDKKNGDRSIVWANKLADDAAHSNNPNSIQNQEARLGITPANLCERTKPYPASFEVYKGALYFTNKEGVFRVTPGQPCTWISRYDASSGSSLAGSGPTPLLNVMSGTSLDGNLLTVTSGPGQTYLMSTNLDTGERRLVSGFNARTPNKGPGAGEADIGFLGTHAATANYYFTTGYTGILDFVSTAVHKQTGERTALDSGGSLSRGNTSNMNIVAAIPGTNTVIVWYEKALHVWDPEKDNSYVLSQ